MNGYCYDLHVHTKEASACGVRTGAEQAEEAHRAGYAGIVISDHFFNGNTAVSAELPWEERVRGLCAGYESARKRGEELGIDVLFAWEYSFWGADFITLGLGTDWLLAHPDVLDWPVEDYLDRVRADGAYVIHAHPFREAWYIRSIRLYPTRVDAVEIVNTSHENAAFNRRAKWYAEEFGLTAVGGSDAHYPGCIQGGVYLKERARTVDELIAQLRGDGILGVRDKIVQKD